VPSMIFLGLWSVSLCQLANCQDQVRQVEIALEGARFSSSIEEFDANLTFRSGVCETAEQALEGEFESRSAAEIKWGKSTGSLYCSFWPEKKYNTEQSRSFFEMQYLSHDGNQLFFSPSAKSMMICSRRTIPMDNPVPVPKLENFSQLERSIEAKSKFSIDTRVIFGMELLVIKIGEGEKAIEFGFDGNKSFFQRYYSVPGVQVVVPECLETPSGSWFAKRYVEIIDIGKGRIQANEFLVDKISFDAPSRQKFEFSLPAGTQFHEAGFPNGVTFYEEDVVVSLGKIELILEKVRENEKIRERQIEGLQKRAAESEVGVIDAPELDLGFSLTVVGFFVVAVSVLFRIQKYRSKFIASARKTL